MKLHPLITPALLATILIPLSAGDAWAGGKKAEKVKVKVELTIRYKADGNVGRLAYQTLPASDLQVGLFTKRNLFGAPILLSKAETDHKGQVSLSATVETNATLKVHLVTDSTWAKTFPGHANVFVVPHKRNLDLIKVSALKSTTHRQVLTFSSGVWSRALHVQHVGAGTLRYSQLTYGSLKRLKRVSYSFPGWLGVGSYASFAQRVVIRDAYHHYSSATVAHETGHAVWYQLRDRVEYYWPMRHTWSKRAGNPSLALSEGWAYAQAIPALNYVAWRAARNDLRRDNVDGAGEGHFHRFAGNRDEVASWGHDGETNVISALYDLWDTQADSRGVVSGPSDLTNGGDLPSGMRGQLVIGKAIRDNARKRRQPSLERLWLDSLRAVYGSRGASTLRLNGISVE